MQSNKKMVIDKAADFFSTNNQLTVNHQYITQQLTIIQTLQLKARNYASLCSNCCLLINTLSFK